MIRKQTWVRKILKKFGVKPEEVIAIGDSKGDMDMFRMVGFCIAFNSSCKDLEQVAVSAFKAKTWQIFSEVATVRDGTRRLRDAVTRR